MDGKGWSLAAECEQGSPAGQFLWLSVHTSHRPGVVEDWAFGDRILFQSGRALLLMFY